MLPIEIIKEIVNFCDKKTQISIRLTSSEMKSIADRSQYTRYIIPIQVKGLIVAKPLTSYGQSRNCDATGIADSMRNRLYIADADRNTIRCVDLNDGKLFDICRITKIESPIPKKSFLALDRKSKRLYFTDPYSGTIFRVDLESKEKRIIMDRLKLEKLVWKCGYGTLLLSVVPFGLALDEDSQMLYVLDHVNFYDRNLEGIRKIDLKNKTYEYLCCNLPLDPARKLYVGEEQRLDTARFCSSFGLVLDSVSQVLYVSDSTPLYKFCLHALSIKNSTHTIIAASSEYCHGSCMFQGAIDIRSKKVCCFLYGENMVVSTHVKFTSLLRWRVDVGVTVVRNVPTTFIIVDSFSHILYCVTDGKIHKIPLLTH